ncbi:MAG: hypothetical protein K0V04_11370 [Deltaproteobacteria bacterium]|nr:hypothetical protein [Deltaproteobacteria bacterium]
MQPFRAAISLSIGLASLTFFGCDAEVESDSDPQTFRSETFCSGTCDDVDDADPCLCETADPCLQGKACSFCKKTMKPLVDDIADTMEETGIGCEAAATAFGVACNAALDEETGPVGAAACVFAGIVFGKQCKRYASPEEIKKHDAAIASKMCAPFCWFATSQS